MKKLILFLLTFQTLLASALDRPILTSFNFGNSGTNGDPIISNNRFCSKVSDLKKHAQHFESNWPTNYMFLIAEDESKKWNVAIMLNDESQEFINSQNENKTICFFAEGADQSDRRSKKLLLMNLDIKID